VGISLKNQFVGLNVVSQPEPVPQNQAPTAKQNLSKLYLNVFLFPADVRVWCEGEEPLGGDGHQASLQSRFSNNSLQSFLRGRKLIPTKFL
jgi:hypothetical protein